jgi:PHS family inorganic phosphate transporter-like MFS transporter
LHYQRSTKTNITVLDLAFYGLGLNNTIVLAAIGYGSTKTGTIYHSLYNAAVGSLIIVCAGSLPGYWLSVVFIDSVGRRPIQIGGFAVLTLLFCIIGFGYHILSEGSLLALYILAQIFFNFGPNTTTFVIPGECFPTRYRSTCHGLSAAMGKLGAIIAQILTQFLLKKDAPANCHGNACSPWLPHLMEIFACFMLCGTLVSFLIPETKLKTLEVLAGEAPIKTRSGNGTPKGGFLSPILGAMSPKTSPVLAPLNKMRRKERERDSNEDADRVAEYPVSISSEVGMLPGRSSARRYRNSDRWRMDDIPLQDVGGLMR